MDFVEDSTGTRSFDLDSLPQDIARNADGSIKHIQVTDRDGKVFRQTWSYTANGKLAGFSAWERQ